MLRINWVNPNTLRHELEPTGILSVGGREIEVQIELFGSSVTETDPTQFVLRALRLLDTAHLTLVYFQEPEPEPSPEIPIPLAFEPDPEEPIGSDFFENP